MAADPAFMPAVYAAIEAVNEKKIAEAQIEHRTVMENTEVIITVELRSEVRHFVKEAE